MIERSLLEEDGDASARLRELYVALDRDIQEHQSEDQRRMLELLDDEIFPSEGAES